MKMTGKLTDRYVVSFKRVNSGAMQVGDFIEVDRHRQEVTADSTESAVEKVVKFQKEQLNRTIKVLGVIQVIEPVEE